MLSSYFCPYHVQKFHASEPEAFRCWSKKMHRGVSAFVESRRAEAIAYFGAALDLAFIRLGCDQNERFSGLNIVKPMEFIVEVLLAQVQFDKSNYLLQDVYRRVGDNVSLLQEIEGTIAKLFVRIELSERAFLGMSTSAASSWH